MIAHTQRCAAFNELLRIFVIFIDIFRSKAVGGAKKNGMTNKNEVRQ